MCAEKTIISGIIVQRCILFKFLISEKFFFKSFPIISTSKPFGAVSKRTLDDSFNIPQAQYNIKIEIIRLTNGSIIDQPVNNMIIAANIIPIDDIASEII